jgi:3-isopropylmalate dehydrogenase
MRADLVLLPGDGIGPEVVAAAVRVLTRVGQLYGHSFSFRRLAIGGAAIREHGSPLPDETLRASQVADAVLLGAVGDPAFDHLPPGQRPESALLALRKSLGVYANLRPARAFAGLESAGPLKPAVLAGTDMIVVRELTGGLYYGQPRGIAEDGASAINTLAYTRDEIVRVTRIAFELARARSRKLVSVDKANVLEVSRLWRQTVTEIARDYPDVALTHEYVDAAAMKIALAPATIDVLLTENMFGDILSDEAGAICGSLGLLPSASLGEGPGLFEPVHGSAPTIAGKDIANPIGAILSAAMLLADGLKLREEGAAVVAAVEQAIALGMRTADIAAAGDRIAGTAEAGEQVVNAIAQVATAR